MAAFDINSGSYVLFPCHVDFFPRVEMLGRIVGGMFGIVGRGDRKSTRLNSSH